MMAQLRLHMFQETSREARETLLDTGKLGEQALEYYSVMMKYKEHGMTDGEASLILGWPRSTVSARRNDIAKEYGHHIIVNINGERRKNPGSGSSTALVWRINH